MDQPAKAAPEIRPLIRPIEARMALGLSHSMWLRFSRRPGFPPRILIDGIVFYDRGQIAAWRESFSVEDAA